MTRVAPQQPESGEAYEYTTLCVVSPDAFGMNVPVTCARLRREIVGGGITFKSPHTCILSLRPQGLVQAQRAPPPQARGA